MTIFAVGLPPLLAAAEVQLIMFVVMVIIGFISWVGRQINAAREAQPPSVRPRRQAADPNRNEVRSFLEDVDAESRRRKDDDILIEVVSDGDAPRPPARRVAKPAGQPARPAARPPQVQRAANRPAPAKPAAARPVGTAPPRPAQRPRPGGQIQPQAAAGAGALGGGVRSHLEEYMGDRIDQQVQQHLSGGVQQSVRQHFGDAPTPVDTGMPAEHPIIRWIRAPGGARQALVVSEVLKPRFRRGARH